MSDDGFTLDVRSFRLSPRLEPYFTALYCMTIAGADDQPRFDLIFPEWTAMRFTQSGSPPLSGIAPEEPSPTWPFIFCGPASRAVRLNLKSSRFWIFGLRPAGWATYVEEDASAHADRICDGSRAAAAAPFAPILDIVNSATGEIDTVARCIEDHLSGLSAPRVAAHDSIVACEKALKDPQVANVTLLADRVGVGRRTLERLCLRYFGFTPKLLLRRQRFMRSLARFTGEPEHGWSRCLDGQYVDQAHFVRDFRRFMGTTPSEFAESRGPMLHAALKRRLAEPDALPFVSSGTHLRGNIA